MEKELAGLSRGKRKKIHRISELLIGGAGENI